MTDHPGGEGSERARDQAQGTAAEEAAKLFVAVRDRLMADPTAARLGSTAAEWLAAFGSPGNDIARDAADECCRCPVCIALAKARSTSPETVEALTAAAIQFAEAVRQAFAPPSTEAEVRHVPLDDEWLTDESNGSGDGPGI
ncbi:MAG: hypothetical protein U0990_06780 [Candidatus Nanopelagicales bacterium]|nr:hypothetical protein [Candidatus Nanopelagicales bacterium]MDZ4249780.1 hypothetical protein [Candidatus Nanopelagicales bacterium]MDZ7576576.1 hypothetical protein [Candidatus Nanopelagicales bacterium]